MPLLNPERYPALSIPQTPDGSRSRRFEPDGIGLACSGGGYKSGAFQVGAFIRLNETGLLRRIDRISSVSGGSIAAAFLGLRWHRLTWKGDIASNFHEVFVHPLSDFFTSRSIDVVSILAGLALPNRSAAFGLQKAYAKYLFGTATLQDFPVPRPGEAPRFVILATDFELNNLWRFAQPYAANYRIGEIPTPSLSLASVVTASSAFPPFFCPLKISLEDQSIHAFSSSDRHRESYMILGDAGIYDNLGLEPVWKRFGTVLVSNAGDPFGEESKTGRWSKVVRRSMSMMHRQAENNRMRWLHSLRQRGERRVADWHLREDTSRYSPTATLALGKVDLNAVQTYPVRLKKISSSDYSLIVRHGYSMCQASLHSAGLLTDAPPAKWPDEEID